MEGLLLTRRDNPKLAEQKLRQVLADATQLPESDSLSRVLMRSYNCLGITLSCMDRYEDSIPMVLRAVEMAEQLGDRAMQADFITNLAEDCIFASRFDEAAQWLKKALSLAEEAGDSDALAWAEHNLGLAMLGSGEPGEAARHIERAISIWRELGPDNCEPGAYADLALAYAAESKLGQTNSRLDRAVEAARHALSVTETPSPRGYCLDALAQVERVVGEVEQAKGHFEQAITILEAAEYSHLAARARRHFAELLAEQGEVERAIKLLEAALLTLAISTL